MLFVAALTVPNTIAAQDFTLPTWSGAYQPQGSDEAGLWMLADEHERVMRDSPVVMTDENLNAYVKRVLCRTVGDDRCAATRIYIVRAPVFNANMAPNGTMRVYTGLLLRARSEAELAAVLGHEFAHFEQRHNLAAYKRFRTGSDIMAWAALLGATAAAMGLDTGSSVRDTQIAVLGSYYRYGREDEREADQLGFSYLASAGYKPSAAADIWRAVMNEADHSAAARGRRSRRYDGVAFFSTHPTELERADTLALLANRVDGGDREGADAYRQALAPWRGQFLADQLKLNDFGASDYLLQRLAGEEWTSDLLFARAELYRERGNPRDLVASAEFYRSALAGKPSLAAAWRGLGLALMRSGERTAGQEALGRYLELSPEASDARMIEMMVEE